MLLPLPSGQLFQIHGSKLKLHPVRHLGQASVLCISITHTEKPVAVTEDRTTVTFDGAAVRDNWLSGNGAPAENKRG